MQRNHRWWLGVLSVLHLTFGTPGLACCGLQVTMGWCASTAEGEGGGLRHYIWKLSIWPHGVDVG